MTDARDAGPAGFPPTRHSVVAGLAAAEEPERRRAAEALVAAYWRPVYLHLRWRWHCEPADAEDLTQEFFLRALGGEYFTDYDPTRSRFRSFLRLCLDRFAARERRDADRLKRGGGQVHLPLDIPGAEALFAAAGQVTEADAEARFHQEWVRALFEAAGRALEQECAGTPRAVRFEVFRRYDLLPAEDGERPGYRQVAEALGIPETQVTNHLAWARREFRRHVLAELRRLTASDAEYREETRVLLGVDPA